MSALVSSRVGACGIALLLVMSLASCSVQDVGVGSTEESLERLRISGSGTCRPLLQILTDEYEDPESEFAYLPGLHSGGGVKGVASGDLDLGMVSRELTDEEKSLDILYTQLSNDGLLIAVHPSVTVDELTTEQVKGLYRGDYESWEELGGPDLPITVLDRNEDESAKIILRQYVLGDLKVTDKAVNLFYEPDMVEGLENTPGAVGYFSLGYALIKDVPVRHVKLDGVEPTVENVESGVYKVIRPLGVVTSVEPDEPVERFLEWARSEEADALIVSKGYGPPASIP